MSERRAQSRPLYESPHQHAPMRTKAGSPFSPWRAALFVLALVLGLAVPGRYGLAEPPAGLSDQDQDMLGVAEINGLAESPQARLDQAVPEAAAINGLAELPAEPADRAELGVAETGESSAFGEKLDIPLEDYLHGWAGPTAQLGFSFVAGFSLGYALAFFLKLTLVIVGSLLLTLFGLQYVGLVEVNWLGLQAYYDALVAWMQPRAGSFREFVASNIPAAGMAALGLLLGLKKK